MAASQSRTKKLDPDDFRMSFGDHLEELRTRSILSLVGIAVATILCLIWNRQVISFVIRPAYVVLRKFHQEPALQSLSPPDTFLIYLKIAALCGLIVAFPWVMYQIWQFVGVGLYTHERRFVRRFGLASPLLFVAGVAFMFFIVLPIVLNFFARFNQSFPVPHEELTWLEQKLVGPEEVPEEAPLEGTGSRIPLLSKDPDGPRDGTLWFNLKQNRLKLAVKDMTFQMQMRPQEYTSAITNQYSIDFYVSFILTLSLAFGIAFQLPIIIIFLILTGIFTAQDIARARGYVILGITIAAAMLTPPDVISQILLAIPMAVLFEIGLAIGRMMLRRSR